MAKHRSPRHTMFVSVVGQARAQDPANTRPVVRGAAAPADVDVVRAPARPQAVERHRVTAPRRRRRLVPQALDEVVDGSRPALDLAAAGFTPTVPSVDVVVADHQDVGHLLAAWPCGCACRAARRPRRRRPGSRPAAAGPRPLGVASWSSRHRQHPHLHRREPRGEGAGVVLDEHAEEPLERAEQRPVDHDRAVAGVVGADVLELEAVGHVEVDLDASTAATCGRWRRGRRRRSWARRTRRRPRPPS